MTPKTLSRRCASGNKLTSEEVTEISLLRAIKYTRQLFMEAIALWHTRPIFWVGHGLDDHPISLTD